MCVCMAGAGSAGPCCSFPAGLDRQGSSPAPGRAPDSPVSPPSGRVLGDAVGALTLLLTSPCHGGRQWPGGPPSPGWSGKGRRAALLPATQADRAGCCVRSSSFLPRGKVVCATLRGLGAPWPSLPAPGAAGWSRPSRTGGSRHVQAGRVPGRTPPLHRRFPRGEAWDPHLAGCGGVLPARPRGWRARGW